MKIFALLFAASGCMTACSVFADPNTLTQSGTVRPDMGLTGFHGGRGSFAIWKISNTALSGTDQEDTGQYAMQELGQEQAIGGGRFMGYVGVPEVMTAMPIGSAWAWTAGVEGRNADRADPSDVQATSAANMVTLGYAWRKLKLEESAFSSAQRDDAYSGKRDLALLDSTSSRLSFQPAPNWIFQFSRGNISNLDQLESGEGLTRTAMSASYHYDFGGADWRTTLAWGRNVRETTGVTLGYLLESTLRFGERGALFGRLERARSREDAPASEFLRRQLYLTNQMTIGYFQDIYRSGPLKYDVGALVKRLLSSEEPSPALAQDRTSGMVFLRLWLP